MSSLILPTSCSLLVLLIMSAVSTVANAAADVKGSSGTCAAPDGNTYKLDEKILTTTFWYQCLAAPAGFAKRPKLRRMGCVGPSQSLLVNGSTFQDKEFAYQCVVGSAGDSVQRKIVGCINFDGKPVSTGEVYLRSSYAYVCNITADGKKGLTTAVGCVNNDMKRMANGDTFIAKSSPYYYQCRLTKHNTGDWLLQVAGCVDDMGNMVNVGKSWLPKADTSGYPGSSCKERHYCKQFGDTIRISNDCESRQISNQPPRSTFQSSGDYGYDLAMLSSSLQQTYNTGLNIYYGAMGAGRR